MPEISETPIDQFTSLAKIPPGEFPALMGGEQAVAEVVDASTGQPVLTGAVQSARVAGSQIWVPNASIGSHRLRIGSSGGANIPLQWFPEGTADTATPPVTIYGDAAGTEVEVGMSSSDPAGSTRSSQLSSHSGAADADVKIVGLLINPSYSRSITMKLTSTGEGEIDDFHRARDFLQAGYVDISLSATVSGTSAVTFASAFTAAPFVVCSTDNRVYVGAGESVGTTGFTAAVRHVDNTSDTLTVRCYWVAVNAAA